MWRKDFSFHLVTFRCFSLGTFLNYRERDASVTLESGVGVGVYRPWIERDVTRFDEVYVPCHVTVRRAYVL